jgi:hypothetical protein
MLPLFEFGINNFASDLREEDDNRIIQVTQNLAGAGCSAKNSILLLEDKAACDQHMFFHEGNSLLVSK